MGGESRTFCCVQCRLLQPPTAACAECGAPTVAPVELVRELLHYRDMNMVSSRDWGLITALIASTSMAFPVLAPVALGSLGVLVVRKLRNLRRPAIAGIAPFPIAVPDGGTTLVGTARRFRDVTTSIVDAAPVLLEQATLSDRRGGVLLRRAASTPFWLDVEGREPVLISGLVRVIAPQLYHHPMSVRRGDRRLAMLGVPDDLAIAGRLDVARLVERGPPITVTGLVEDEPIAELAFHRDGGVTRVMRGRAGAVVRIG
jgi:hypothetical protein